MNIVPSGPVAVADRAVPGAVNPPSLVRRHDCPGTILLVEDDAAIREVVREILCHASYQVLTAESEAQALEVWDRFGRRIDLLLTDVMIPYRTTGLALAKKLKGSRPELKVVYMSGFGREIGCGDPALATCPFLKKPFTPEELIVVVAATLGIKASRSGF